MTVRTGQCKGRFDTVRSMRDLRLDNRAGFAETQRSRFTNRGDLRIDLRIPKVRTITDPQTIDAAIQLGKIVRLASRKRSGIALVGAGHHVE